MGWQYLNVGIIKKKKGNSKRLLSAQWPIVTQWPTLVQDHMFDESKMLWARLTFAAIHNFMQPWFWEPNASKTKNPILDTQTYTCADPQSGNPQNQECMLIVATPRPRVSPDVYPDFHMNWFMKLLWTHPFAHFKFEDIFLSHQRAQAQANPHPVTPEWQDPNGKSRYALLLLTLPVSASPLTRSWRALDFTQAREECSSAFLSHAVLLLFPISKCCLC